VDGATYDVSLPRKDSRQGNDPTRHDYVVEYDPQMLPSEACRRRDYTCNALLFDPLTGELLDFFDGVEDIQQGLLRAVDMNLFADDPLRALRGMQFVSRFGWDVEVQTEDLLNNLGIQIRQRYREDAPDPELGAYPELKTWHGRNFYRATGDYLALSRLTDKGRCVSRERVAEEWLKWATKSTRPSLGLEFLSSTLWDVFYPELRRMYGCPQDPEWHPEGDVYRHTRYVVDAANNIAIREKLEPEARAVLVFSALCHDFAKPVVTAQLEKKGKLRWTSHGHERAGGPIAQRFLDRIGITKMHPQITAQVVPLVEDHLAHRDILNSDRPETVVRRLAKRLAPANIQMLAWLMEADASGRPPLPTGMPVAAFFMLELAEKLNVYYEPPAKLVLGRHVMPYFEYKGGPHIGEAVAAAYEAQLNGDFSDTETGLRWLHAQYGHRLEELPVA
jgi:tRNA nucleotidyltransferase (CCA-adding enzyme)